MKLNKLSEVVSLKGQQEEVSAPMINYLVREGLFNMQQNLNTKTDDLVEFQKMVHDPINCFWDTPLADNAKRA